MTDPFRRTSETHTEPSETEKHRLRQDEGVPDGFEVPDRCRGCNASLKPEGHNVMNGRQCPHCGYDVVANLPGNGAGQHEADRRGSGVLGG